MGMFGPVFSIHLVYAIWEDLIVKVLSREPCLGQNYNIRFIIIDLRLKFHELSGVEWHVIRFAQSTERNKAS